MTTTLTEQDKPRLAAARNRVFALMRDAQWHTAEEIRKVGGSEGLRRLREFRADGYLVERRHIRNGLWEYRML